MPYVLFVVLTWIMLAGTARGQTLNGFDLSTASIPPSLIRGGGPPRDGIPAIDKPVFQSASSADWLDPEDRVIGIVLNGIARAYPIAILNWHEVANDVIAGQRIVVTFCPLCGTGMVFESNVEGQALTFGVSGLLYESDVLLYDRQTESLWSQILSKGVSGEMRGKPLHALPVTHTSWRAWRQSHPESEVLSRDTGSSRNYGQDPYIGYADSPRTMFPVVNQAPGPWHSKEWVLGFNIGDQYKAYPFIELRANSSSQIQDQLSGESFTVIWDEANQSASIVRDGLLQPSITAFWFAWYAFHPETLIFTAN